MARGTASLQDVKGRAQVRTYQYPYTYTFYTIEHCLETKGFQVRLSNIGRGRILAHFSDDVQMAKGRQGFVDISLEARDDGTQLKMTSSTYNRMNDSYIVTFRGRLLRLFQDWLDLQLTMTVPMHEGDIPRFHEEHEGRFFMSRPTRLARPDTGALERNIIALGVIMTASGLVIVIGMGIWPAWALALVILTGLTFLMISMLIAEGMVELALSMYTSLGYIVGALYIILTVFIGLFVIVIPVALIDLDIWELRTWSRFYEELEMEGMTKPPEMVGPPKRELLPNIPWPGRMY
jgi:hypothetical protein